MIFLGIFRIVIFFLFSAKIIFASLPQIEAEVDKNVVTIGDEIILTLKITSPEEIKVIFPQLDDFLGEFKIKAKKELPVKKEKTGKNVFTQQYLLTIFTVGEHKIPALKVEYFSPTGEKGKLTTLEIPITVKSVLEKLKKQGKEIKDIRGLKSPAVLKHSFWFYLGWALLFLGIIFILLLVFYLWRRKKKKIQPVKEMPPTRTPAEIALEELEKLKKSNLLSQGKIKLFYIELSNIIRQFLEAKFQIETMDKTTFEITLSLKKKNLTFTRQQQITSFLEDCDLVKFAKYLPQRREIEENYETAIRIVKGP
jgi:hypothetical protein